MQSLISILLEEFRESLPDTADSVRRKAAFTDVLGMANVAIGVRRCGKTYLIYQKIRDLLSAGVSLDQILFINFEDDRLLPMGQRELGRFIEAFYAMFPQNYDQEVYLFLDEIQNVEGWPLVIRRFLDTKKMHIYLTGSSAKLLSTEIATQLRGRSIATEVWPYSFEEYCEAHAIEPPVPPIGNKAVDQFTQHFTNYFVVGGFPAVQNLHANERRVVLQTYIDTVVFRDIVERHKISNTTLIKYLIKTLIQNIACPFSVNKFYKDAKSQGFKVGKDTVYLYLGYIEDAFLAFQLSLFSESVRKVQANPKKIYVVDNGLIKSNQLKASFQYGNLFENQVYLDLRREGKRVWYYLTEDGYEVDFVVEHLDGSFELLQVVWDMSDVKTVEREQRALKQAEGELGIKGRIVTAQDYLQLTN